MKILDSKSTQADRDATGQSSNGARSNVSEKKLWRNREELQTTPDHLQRIADEFPRFAGPLLDTSVDRRRFVEIMGASLGLAGMTACTRQPPEKIVPYVRQPEEIVPGRPLFYATATVQGGYGRGVLAESHMGRPTKLEGNPDHPASLGGTDLFDQASILDLYDPDRSQVVTHLDKIRTWSAFNSALASVLTAQEATGGAGLRLLTGTVTSPTLAGQLDAFLERFPAAKVVHWEPAGPHGATLGGQAAFGDFVSTHYDFSVAKVVVAFDSDFLTLGPGSVRYARDFAAGRRVADEHSSMSRYYAVESSPTASATLADHRLAVRSTDVESVAVAVAAALGIAGADREAAAGVEHAEELIAAIAADLQAHAGESVVIAGDAASSELHTVVAAINRHLGNFGATVKVGEPIETRPQDQVAALSELAAEMHDGQVDTLIVFDSNPIYSAPRDLDLVTAFEKVGFRVHYGLYADETARYCHWHVPAAHVLESWGDVRAHDGTATLIQPLILPLYGGKMAVEMMGQLLGRLDSTGEDEVKDHWRSVLGANGAEFDSAWKQALHDGALADSSVELLTDDQLEIADGAVASAAAAIAERHRSAAGGDGFELLFRADSTVFDGRYANNGWLQECPKPLTKLTWDNALLMAPKDAAELGVATEDVVEVAVGDNRLQVAVWVLPTHARGAMTLHLGSGRTYAGRVGDGCGVDTSGLRSSGAMWAVQGVGVSPVAGETYPLATTQEHHLMENRHLVREANLEYYRDHPDFAQHAGHGPAPDISLFPSYDYPGNAWGMSIDLSSCTGCNACVIACQSENNIPVVGKEQVRAGREMHWLRIDRYFEGESEEATHSVYHQPVLCMHCENAPCEVVCPVGATNHSDEGLNDMVYNRCVGTRYCANNCPYKVRRFNFFKYADDETPVRAAGRNPDVTIRSRGVMEKCSYCVQRINQARIEAGREDRAIADGEVVTACQQACPTEAIVFGNINDPDSKVASRKADSRSYGLLEETNTKPRTTYVARLRNPSPDLEAADAAHGHSKGHG